MKKILLVDDERNVHYSFQRALGEAFRIISAFSGEEALEKLAAEKPHLVLLDVKLPGLGGLELLQQIKGIDRELPVVLLTAYGTTDTAITAMKLGAYDYLLKPVDMATLKGLIATALRLRALAAQVDSLPVPEAVGEPSLLGRSAAMQDLYKMIGRVAPTDMTVLLSGESGTGKELVARAIHQHSMRAEGSWVALNCAAIPESLLESELFGHEKGAFTGATEHKPGCFGEATIAKGEFREDLYYRLNVIHLHLPPLRARQEDIPLLAHYFLTRSSRGLERPVGGFTPEALDRLLAHTWPGNVRELENTINQALLTCRGDLIAPEDLRLEELPPSGEPLARPQDRFGEGLEQMLLSHSGEAYRRVEDRLIRKALELTKHNQVQAAHLLGISRNILRHRMKQCGLL
jgi:DNA-binding NtrC family response regulator